MKMTNRLKMVLSARSVNESFARVAVCAFLSSLDPTIEEIGDIKTAVSEAVTNCIVHAYKEEIGLIYIDVRIQDSGKVIIKIKDKGCGIDDVKKAMEPLFTTSENGERAGLGFALMESMTDKVRVFSKVGFGTTVTLEKTLKVRSDEK